MNRHDRRVRRRAERLTSAVSAQHPASEAGPVSGVQRLSFIERARQSAQRAKGVGSDDADLLPEPDAEGAAALADPFCLLFCDEIDAIPPDRLAMP